MNPIRQMMQECEAAKEALASHCLCALFVADSDYAMVYLPAGYPVDAVRCHFSVGKAEAYRRVERKLEAIWQETKL